MCWAKPQPPSPFSCCDLEEASNPKVTPRRSVHILGSADGRRLGVKVCEGSPVVNLPRAWRSVCLSVCLSVLRERMNGRESSEDTEGETQGERVGERESGGERERGNQPVRRESMSGGWS